MMAYISIRILYQMGIKNPLQTVKSRKGHH
nr:MAG TPA: hypothetical protein [Caudoviricetes sp.]